MKKNYSKIFLLSFLFWVVSGLHARKTEYFVKSNNAAKSNSTIKNFLLTAYNPPYAWRGAPYNDSDFIYYKNANFDNFMWVRDEDELMDKVHKYHFKYFISIRQLFPEEDSNGVDILRGVRYSDDGSEIYNEPTSEVTEEMLQDVDELVEKYKNDPDLIGYWICDEPYPTAYGNIAKVIDRIRKKDTEHYSLVNIGDDEYTTDENIEHFLDTTKINVLCYDRYNFFNGYDLNDNYFELLKKMRQHALMHNIPFFNIIQAVGTNGTSAEELDWRTPNNAEHRWLVYTSLVYGVHGIAWFHWDAEDWGVVENPDRDIIYPSIQNINAEIDSLSKIMVHLTTTHVYHIKDNNDNSDIIKSISNNADVIIGAFKNEEFEENYFMLMNADYSEDVSAQVTMNYDVDDLKFFNVENNKWEEVPFENNASGATYSIQLRKGGGKLFKFKKKNIIDVSKSVTLPKRFALKQNYPNPFNPTTTISYTIPNIVKTFQAAPEQDITVQLRVYDVLGREITTLINKKQKPGNYQVTFNADNLPSGIYYYKLQYGEYNQIRKMLLLK